MAKKIQRLSESELKSRVRDIVMESVSTFFGEEEPFPRTLPRRYGPYTDLLLEKATLNEGLIRTYPMDWVEKYVRKRLGSDCLSAWRDYDTHQLGFRFKPGSKSIEPLKAKMDSFGYFCSVEDTDNDRTYLQFEAKFDECIKGFEFRARKGQIVLYHVSPERYKNKILKCGLVPKSKNDFLKYPDRIYFVLTQDGEDAAYNMADMLYTHDYNEQNNGNYVLYGITLDGLEDTNFYIDWNTEDWHAVYTHDNIPPKNIRELETFPANEL